MKRIYITGMVWLAFLFVSCNQWLDVRPELDIYEETMFEQARGYYTALNGLYISMSKSDLYGRELSWGAVEAWGRSYELHETAHETYLQIMNFEYDKKGAKDIATSIWLGCYNVIAEANNLIQNLENDKEVKFKHGDVTKNMILGEAYAIRALMHFELVRIFTKAPVDDRGGVSAYIPYVTTYPSRVNSPMQTKQVLSYIISDLEKARLLVQPFDMDKRYPGYVSSQNSFVSYRVKLNNTFLALHTEEEFFRYRGNRLSYYPINQLLARVCLYAGERDKGYEYANEIVTLVNKKTAYKFVAPASIGDPLILNTVEPRLHTEMLFATYNAKLPDWTEKYFGLNAQNFKLAINDKLEIFQTNPADIRLAAIPLDMVTKFSLEGKVKANMLEAEYLIPVMRFPECYYIAAECIFDKDKARAVEIFNEVVEARKNTVYKLDPTVDKATFMEAVVQEYRREFLCEGQMVYVYKRLNLPLRVNGTFVEHNGKLVMPVPDKESGL